MNRKRSRKLSKRNSKNKKSMKRSNSRKTSKRQSKRSPKRRYRSTYKFPGKVEMLGICTLDTSSNYNKINIVLDTLRDNRILPDKKDVNFCMLNVDTNEAQLFDCQIKGIYGKNNLSQVYNKKYNVILLDGCPYLSQITFYTPQNILQLEKNLIENGYIVITTPSRVIPEDYMEDKRRVKMKEFWLNTFRKVSVLKMENLYMHIYQKNIKYDEDEPGSYNPYGEGISGVPGGPSF